MKKLVLSVLVANHSGVLSRVAGLFSRRGYNIDSLSVGVTQDPDTSRMTIVARGDDQNLEQIKKQLNKLIDVKKIVELPSEESVYRELALIKVKATEENRASITGITDIFRAKIIDVATESLTIEITGDQSKLDALIELLSPYGIKETVRTGLTGIKRGNEEIQN
ncbi:acetolactate synthase small subunit [Natranaerovirga hydrolytica]|uniref:Acetolactate synthase small subunit n=1 Tax=Natranaerovirga hydrolytica TaxID=680378 RepID=A0A4R1MYQ2_9FIRM|nr:acetolactate synthase small subunit [Natranaerovirga hydrolytica]TCK98438.1 acetolactate synthase small subunit [Natranaerovirga hydrolytica]